MKTIEVRISDDGKKITLHIQGAKGPVCLKDTAALEAALGGGFDHTLTDEYNDREDEEEISIHENL